MDIEILPLHWSSILAICIMIGVLIFSYFKKWMITHGLIIANFVVFFITVFFYKEIVFGYVNGAFGAGLAFKPIYLSVENSPQLYTLFTSMFIHADFLHIFGNIIVFFFIGIAFENRIGWKKFIIIYILSGICGTITHSLMNPGSSTPLIGASGAIFGIMGAFAFSHPRDEIVMPVVFIITRVKVIYGVLIFALLETFIVILSVQDQTAHFAHFGGLIGGFIIAAIILRNKRTHTKEGKTIYYDSFADRKLKNIDFSTLKKLADTPGLKEMLEKIEKETIPQVQEMWLERFIEKAVCPKCKNKLNYFEGKVWCENCKFKTKI